VPDLAALHARALGQIDELLAVAEDPGPFPAARTPASSWSALEHAEHMARADDGALHQLEAALERDGGPRIKLAGRVVLRLGWIPRGVGKAPATTRPDGADRRRVADALVAARRRLGELAPRLDEIARSRGRASHPIFGGLSAAQWLRFLTVHHHHHLKIIADVRRAYERSAAPSPRGVG